LVETGLYKENLFIQTPNIFIQAKSSDSQVFLLGSNGPTISVDINEKGYLNI